MSLEDVQARTGFPVHARPPVPASPAPADAELELLRGRVRAELAEFYPEFVRARA